MKILLTLLLLSPLAFAEEYKGPLTIEGEMRCKVKDQIILATADGKSQRYAGVENSFNVGDTLFFTYQYTEYFMVPSSMLILKLQDRLRDESVVYFSEVNSRKPSSFETSSLSSELIYITQAFGKQLSLRRYYKNDWEGIYSVAYGPEFDTWTATLDCRNEEGRLEELIKAYEKNTKSDEK